MSGKVAQSLEDGRRFAPAVQELTVIKSTLFRSCSSKIPRSYLPLPTCICAPLLLLRVGHPGCKSTRLMPISLAYPEACCSCHRNLTESGITYKEINSAMQLQKPDIIATSFHAPGKSGAAMTLPTVINGSRNLIPSPDVHIREFAIASR